MYYTPADGVSYSKGLWRECTWATFPGEDRCQHISPSDAYSWERACQGLWIIFFILEFITAVLFTASMRAALRTRHQMEERGERVMNPYAKTAGLMSLLCGFIGLVVMSVFVAKNPDSGAGVDADNKSRHLHWSYGLFTAAWALATVVAPIGLAA